MTDNAKTKFETVEKLRKDNPTWSIKKSCAKAKMSVPSYYETKKELSGVTAPFIVTRTTVPLWKQVLHSNLPTSTKLEILQSL